MNINYFLGILVAILVVILGAEGYIYYVNHDPYPLVDDRLEGNPAAIEIANSYHVQVFIEDLGTDGNGYTVCGQTRFVNGQVYQVVLDDAIDPNSYQAKAILYHELGHIVNPSGDEAAADDFAASRGYNITDAYHGIH
jgi:hypothetical protein